MKTLKLIIEYNIERLHRHVFDTYYIQTYKIKPTDRIVLFAYKVLVSLFKKFRVDLRLNKELFRRAYNQRRLSLKYVCIYFLFMKKNYVRYTLP
jgi:hypothetical protein